MNRIEQLFESPFPKLIWNRVWGDEQFWNPREIYLTFDESRASRLAAPLQGLYGVWAKGLRFCFEELVVNVGKW
jgi:hypothetical protein